MLPSREAGSDPEHHKHVCVAPADEIDEVVMPVVEFRFMEAAHDDAQGVSHCILLVKEQSEVADE